MIVEFTETITIKELNMKKLMIWGAYIPLLLGGDVVAKTHDITTTSSNEKKINRGEKKIKQHSLDNIQEESACVKAELIDLPKKFDTYNNRKWLYRTVYHEARGEPLEGQIAVMDVVITRVMMPNYPATPYSVLSQKNAFGWFRYSHKRNMSIYKIDDSIKNTVDLYLKGFYCKLPIPDSYTYFEGINGLKKNRWLYDQWLRGQMFRMADIGNQAFFVHNQDLAYMGVK